MSVDHEETSQMIEDCLKRTPGMTEWEKEFIHSISEIDPERLTNRQLDRLGEIWERVT
jgi:hypothetical protein